MVWNFSRRPPRHLGYQNRRILAVLNLYVPPKLPIKFQLNPTYSLWDIVWRISWLSQQKDFTTLNLYVTQMPPIKFPLNLTYGLGDVIWRLSRSLPCRPSWYRYGTILNILDLNVAPKPPIKFQFNPTYDLGGDIVWRISRWSLWWPSWLLEMNDFSSSESLCLPSSLGSIRLTVWEMSFEEFQDGWCLMTDGQWTTGHEISNAPREQIIPNPLHQNWMQSYTHHWWPSWTTLMNLK